MRLFIIIFNAMILCHVSGQYWKIPKGIYDSFSWLRQGKNSNETITTLPPLTTMTLSEIKAIGKRLSSNSRFPLTTKALPSSKLSTKMQTGNSAAKIFSQSYDRLLNPTTSSILTTNTTKTVASSVWTTVPLSTQSSTTKSIQNILLTSTPREIQTQTSTLLDVTTQEVPETTAEPRDNHRVHDFFLSKHGKPQVKVTSNISQNLLPLPEGAGAALVKPTKYHYYPHNQHIYLLPECAIQQVCNAVYIRLNWTQPLCACPSRYRDPCSASLNSDDHHTTELLTDKRRKALTLAKTCEPTAEMRVCRNPRDWSLLALQNIRTGKSHYLVICRCPEVSILDGPMSHDQPTYASVPGIRVFGMMCVQKGIKRNGRPLRFNRSVEVPELPWKKIIDLSNKPIWD